MADRRSCFVGWLMVIGLRLDDRWWPPVPVIPLEVLLPRDKEEEGLLGRGWAREGGVPFSCLF